MPAFSPMISSRISRVLSSPFLAVTPCFNERKFSMAQEEMDRIRARSLLKHTYNYAPPADIDNIIVGKAEHHGFKLDQNDWRKTDISLTKNKSQLLLDLGQSLKHFVPNSKLHKMKSLYDLAEFYAQPVSNITKYSEMARSENLPSNLSIMEHPRRFHPNDQSALHGGITAFPGEGGKIYGLRNKRIYREFKPKKEWFDYEDQNFVHDVTLSEGMPWDREIANKMDSNPDVKFTKDHLKKIR